MSTTVTLTDAELTGLLAFVNAITRALKTGEVTITKAPSKSRQKRIATRPFTKPTARKARRWFRVPAETACAVRTTHRGGHKPANIARTFDLSESVVLRILNSDPRKYGLTKTGQLRKHAYPTQRARTNGAAHAQQEMSL